MPSAIIPNSPDRNVLSGPSLGILAWLFSFGLEHSRSDLVSEQPKLHHNYIFRMLYCSPVDMCNQFWYNRPDNGKDAKFGTNKADIIKINNRIGGILILLYFLAEFQSAHFAQRLLSIEKKNG